MQMSSPQEVLATETMRLMTRVEFDRLCASGYFADDERVELLFGVVVVVPAPDPEHDESVCRVHEYLLGQISRRAQVRSQAAFNASDYSVPLPDVYVTPNADYWHVRPDRAYLVVEVSRSSRAKDRGLKARLYGLAEVDEYWVVDHVAGVVEVRRDRRDGEWQTVTTHARGETIAMQAFPDVRLAVSEILPPSP